MSTSIDQLTRAARMMHARLEAAHGVADGAFEGMPTVRAASAPTVEALVRSLLGDRLDEDAAESLTGTLTLIRTLLSQTLAYTGDMNGTIDSTLIQVLTLGVFYGELRAQDAHEA